MPAAVAVTLPGAALTAVRRDPQPDGPSAGAVVPARRHPVRPKGVLVDPLLAGSGHGREDLLDALHRIAAVPPRRQDARQLASLGPCEDRAGAHLKPASHLGGAQQNLEVVRGGLREGTVLALLGRETAVAG